MLNKSLLIVSLILAIGCAPDKKLVPASVKSGDVNKQEVVAEVEATEEFTEIIETQFKLLDAGCTFKEGDTDVLDNCDKADSKVIEPFLKTYISKIELFMNKYNGKKVKIKENSRQINANENVMVTVSLKKAKEILKAKTESAQATKAFMEKIGHVTSPAMQKTNQALILTSASLPAPLGQCVLAIDVVDPATQTILITYNNCAGIFQGAPQLYQCSNSFVCEATNGDLNTHAQYGVAAVVTPYGAYPAGPVASATVQYMYRVTLGERTVMITRTMLNIGTAGTSNTQEFSFASSIAPSGYRAF